jgi:hypothetical protein
VASAIEHFADVHERGQEHLAEVHERGLAFIADVLLSNNEEGNE